MSRLCFMKGVDFHGEVLVGKPTRTPKSGSHQWFTATMDPKKKTWRVWPSGIPIQRADIVLIDKGLSTVKIGVSNDLFD